MTAQAANHDRILVVSSSQQWQFRRQPHSRSNNRENPATAHPHECAHCGRLGFANLHRQEHRASSKQPLTCWLFGPTASTSMRPNPSSTLLPLIHRQLATRLLLLLPSLLPLAAAAAAAAEGGSLTTSSDSPVSCDSSTLQEQQSITRPKPSA